MFPGIWEPTNFSVTVLFIANTLYIHVVVFDFFPGTASALKLNLNVIAGGERQWWNPL